MGKLALALVLIVQLCPAAIKFRHGDTAYVVAAPRTDVERGALSALTGYLRGVLGKEPLVVAAIRQVPTGKPAIVLRRAGEASPVPADPPSGSQEAFAVSSGRATGRELVVLAGATDRGLRRAVHRLVIKSEQTGGNLDIPDLKLAEKPWIPEREWAVCPWAPQFVRGAFVNPYADPRMDIWRYSDRQLADYVDMFDWFGFSGVQLLETSYSYSVMGSPEAFQDRQRTLARRAHQNGQSVSLWVWAAEFNGYGWSDPDVVYDPQPGMTAFDDPRVRRGFEKYYDHYARLAPDVDRLIGHFYDPGRLHSRDDVFHYMRLLEQKFRERNPKIRMAIDSWAAGPDYLQALIDSGELNQMLMRGPSASP